MLKLAAAEAGPGAVAGAGCTCMVNVLPEPVWPYAKMVPLYPRMTSVDGTRASKAQRGRWRRAECVRGRW